MAEKKLVEGLKWVKGEIATTLRPVLDLVEADGASTSPQVQAAAIQALDQVHGVLLALQLSPSARLIQELKRLVEARTGHATENETGDTLSANAVAQLLGQGLTQMNRHLDRLDAGYDESPLSLWSIINEVRAACDEPPLTHSELLTSAVTKRSGDFQRTPEALDALSEIVRQVRPQYHRYLVEWYRSDPDSQVLVHLGLLFRHLHDYLKDGVLADLFRLAEVFAEALQDRRLTTDAQLRSLMGHLDRVLKPLVQKPPQWPEADALLLIEHLLNSLYEGAVRSPLIDRLQSWYGSTQARMSLSREDLAGSDGDTALAGLVSALLDEFSRLKREFDRLTREEQTDRSALDAFSSQLHRLAQTLDVADVGDLPRRLHQLAEDFGNLALNGIGKDQTRLESYAMELLSIEALLLAHADPRSTQAKQLIAPEMDLSELTAATLREAGYELIRVKDAIGNCQVEQGTTAGLAPVSQHLQRVSGALTILSEMPAARLAQSIGDLVQQRYIKTERIPTDAEFEHLADAIAALELYLGHLQEAVPFGSELIERGARSISALQEVIDEPPKSSPKESGTADSFSRDRPAAIPEPTLPAPAVVNAFAISSDSEFSTDDETEFLDIFLEEAREETASARIQFARWESNPNDTAALVSLRRSFHTLKGSGRLVGALEVADFAAAVEALLNRLIEERAFPSEDLLRYVGEAVSQLPSLVAATSDGLKLDTESLIARANQLRETASFAAQPESPAKMVQAESANQTATDAPQSRIVDHDSLFTADEELLRIFQTETHEHLAELRTFLMRTDVGEARVDEPVQRALHTLTGSARMAGIDSIALVVKGLEHCIKPALEQGIALDAQLLALFGRALAGVEKRVDELPNIGDGAQILADLVIEIEQFVPFAISPEQTDTLADLIRADAIKPDFYQDTDQFTALPEPALSQTPFTLTEVTVTDEKPDVDFSGQWIDQAILESAELENSIEPTAIEIETPLPPAAIEQDERIPETAERDDLASVAALEMPLPPAAIEQDERIPETAERDDLASVAVAALETPLPPAASDQSSIAHVAGDENLESAVAASAIGGEISHAEPDVVSYAPIAVTAEPSPDWTPVTPPQTIAPSDAMPAPDPELAALFLEDARDLLDNLDTQFRNWQLVPQDISALDGINRLLHTLKGSARLTGLSAIGDLSHALETRLKELNDDPGAVNDVTLDLTQRTVDSLSIQVDALEQGVPIPKMTNLIDALNCISPAATGEPASHTEIAPSPSPIMAALSPEAFAGLAVSVREEAAQSGLDGATAVSVSPQIRVRSDLLNRLVNHAGEISIYRGRLTQRNGLLGLGLGELDQTVTRLSDKLRLLEIETQTQIMHRFEREREREGDASEYDREFDPLELDRFSKLQQLSGSLAETVNDLVSVKEMLGGYQREFMDLLTQQARIADDLQDGLLRTRLVPFVQVVPRLHRLVRQTADSLNKLARLEVIGSEVELDRSILDRLVAPLEHLLRNAVDHGLENPEVRTAAGKPAMGQVTLALHREGNDAVISLSDDGKGMDLVAIRRQAIARKLLAPETVLPDEAMLQFILEPGFTTSGKITQISGRGVGLDVVASEIKAANGSITLESIPGQGARFTVRLPLTLAIIEAFLVGVGDNIYAVPHSTVEAAARINRDDLLTIYRGEAEGFTWRDHGYKVVYVGGVLDPTHEPELGERRWLPLLLIRLGEQRVALHIDTLLESQRILVKPLGPQLSSVRWLSGGTILPDGRVALILDALALLRSGAVQNYRPMAAVPDTETKAPICVMVVDDSLTVRRVTSRLLRRQNIEVLTAKDGVEALTLLDERIPDLMLLDVEMPRMDGYELARHIRRSDGFRTLPMIMITSRTGAKHRDYAMRLGVDRYLGKPYQESELLDEINSLLAERAG